MNHKLTVIILTKNEEKNIKECIQSVSFADEIIIIDDNSSDNTVGIAEKMGATVYTRKLDDFASQRNFGLSKSGGEWVLYIDADERVSPELKNEIFHAITSSEANSYYKIPRKNNLFGKYLEHTDWYPDFQHRLFKNGSASWDRKVHEQLKTKYPGIELSHALLHQNYGTIDQFINKNFGVYADYEAGLLISSGYKFEWTDLIRKPVNEFLRRFFATAGYKDGLHGFVASVLVSFAAFVVYAKVWEKEGFKEQSTPLPTVKREFNTTVSEFVFWIKKLSIEGITNPLIRTIRRIF